MRRAFTLVELMIVVAIIGILAAVAVPNFMQMQLKAKRAEVMLNMDGISTAQYAFHASYDEYVSGAKSNPGSPLTKKAKAFLLDQDSWTDLSWQPDGAVRCTYATSSYGGGDWFRVDGTCDLDDDNSSAIVRYYSHEASDPGWRDLYPDRY